MLPALYKRKKITDVRELDEDARIIVTSHVEINVEFRDDVFSLTRNDVVMLYLLGGAVRSFRIPDSERPTLVS